MPTAKRRSMSHVTSTIAGRRHRGHRDRVEESRNPADLRDLVATVDLVTPAGIVAACRAAHAAQAAWAATPPPRRARVVQQAGRLVEANKPALARILTREIGKPYVESLGEVQEIIDQCDFFLGEGRRLYGQTVPSEMASKQLFTFRVPVGVSMIITAGNFPVAVPAWYIVPALVCGNTIVWKPAEYTPALADALATLFMKAGVPKGVLNVVHAEGPSTFAGLQAALEEGLVDKVGFTGSSAVGERIGELCGRHLQNPCLELGGKNPLVVMPDADIDLAVEGAVFSGFAFGGQRCTSLGTVFCHEDVHDAFLSKFSRSVERAPIGDPTKDVLFGPLMNERFLERFLEFLDLIEPHHTVSGSSRTGRITAGNRRRGFVGDPAHGLFVHPMIVDGIRPDDALYFTETFGPLVGVGTFRTMDEAIALANGHGYGLSSAIYTTSPEAAFTFRAGVSAGMVSVNNSTAGAESHLPFGGNGRSGNGGRQSGMWVLDQFTKWQSMNWDYAGHLQRAQIDVEDVGADLDFRL
jgi:acyl-CoA reductase-like NAD-dependent aldehyde dehydrogenase